MLPVRVGSEVVERSFRLSDEIGKPQSQVQQMASPKGSLSPGQSLENEDEIFRLKNT